MSEIRLVPEDAPNYTASVLRLAASGIILGSALVAPNALQLLAYAIGSKAPDRALRSARYAKSRGWITFRETTHGIEVALTASGKLKWLKVDLATPLEFSAGKWDGRWRLVMFDIPTRHNKSASPLRSSLRQLGFKQLQRSVWITPYPCQTQIDILRQIYGIRRHVRLAEVSAIDDEVSIKQLFHI